MARCSPTQQSFWEVGCLQKTYCFLRSTRQNIQYISMCPHNAMHLSKCGVSLARYCSVENWYSSQQTSVSSGNEQPQHWEPMCTTQRFSKGVSLSRLERIAAQHSFRLVQRAYTHIRYIYIYTNIHIYIYICNVIIYSWLTRGSIAGNAKFLSECQFS